MYAVQLVISICHPLLTQAMLQVLASYSMQRFFQLPRLNSHSHALNSHSHPIPIPWLILFPRVPWDPWDPSLPHSHAHLYYVRRQRLIHASDLQLSRTLIVTLGIIPAIKVART